MNRTYTVCLGLVLFVISHVPSAYPVTQKKESSKEATQYLVSMPGLGTFLIQADEERLVYYLQGNYIAPRISPDKSQILLHSKREGRIGIWLGDLGGKDLQRLCDGDQANWSPDGKEIVFRREGKILQRDLTTGDETTSSPSELSDCMFPSYLSENRVLFVSQGSIYFTGGVSSSARFVARGEVRSAPRASPDGLKVVWQDGSHLFLSDLRSEEITQLTTQGGIQSWPVWSEDGEYLAYSQSPHPSGPWDIYVTASMVPGRSWLIRRNIHPNIDWSGPYTPYSDSPTVVEHHLTFNPSESGDVSTENRWFTAIHSSRRNNIRIFMKEGTGEAFSLEISPTSPSQEPKSEPHIQLTSWDRDETRPTLLDGAVDSTPDSIVVSFSKYRPMIEVECNAQGSVSLNTNTRCALIPDRLADDLLLNPSDYTSSRITLPYAPLLIAPLQDNSATMLIISPNFQQRIELRSGPKSFEQMEIYPGDEKVYIALLETKDAWHDVRVLPSDPVGSWRAEWSHPFLAQWRFAAVGEDQDYSRTWGEESINLNRSSFLPIDSSFTVQPDSAVVYLFGRSSNTPLDTITPLDFLVDALGVEEGYSLLDESGIRSFRTANGPSSFRAITTRDEEWSRELVHVDSRDPNWVELGVLESMQGLRAVDTPGVRLLITNFGEDIFGILEGLEERIREYQGFVDRLAAYCRSSATHTKGSRRFLSTVEDQITVLVNQVEQMPVSSNEVVRGALGEIVTALGPGSYLHSTEEYGKLSRVVRACQTDRLEIIRLYREFAKALRNRAGKAVIRDSELQTVGNELRAMTQEILRQRYYLEGDWGGETPLKEDVD